MRVLVTGGTGFVGRHLAARLAARGESVIVGSRNPAGAATARPMTRSSVKIAAWDPLDVGSITRVLAGCDAIIHLAGAPAVGQRWTPAVKARIRDSRIATTEAIVRALPHAIPRPKTLICASAVGYYGSHDDGVELGEEAPAGRDFLAIVCRDWEAAAQRATEHALRVVQVRLGVVLGPDGGALEQMVQPFRLHVGGRIGSGRQVVSWVHLEDAVSGFLACLDDDRLVGPVNLTAPNPVSNAELARELGRALRSPAWVPAPESMLRLRFGEGAEPLLTGQRVLPRRLQAVGFEWRFPDVRSALSDLLG